MSYPQQQPAFSPATGETPLWAPLYGASFQQAVQRFFKKYTTFSGRASRSEYWWWALVSFAVSIVINVLTSTGMTTAASGATALGPGAVVGLILGVIWVLATIVPSLALLARRLHDVNLSAWLILVVLVPFLGGLALLVMTILPTNPAGQRFDQPSGY
ncbi:Inner membrane protein YhaI [Arthrobacter sp. SO5]|uniref:DUF805 domain-containing protein n=1 Tax=Arthrobacter sp. SO5 TaxID=1897055 RepID=UPI001E614059|nr:DUF805 domain-containing protein [Arthrobacter sp. SO5]MCB5274250.1 Inner membrane protein YhaI [Arthrobacter sp. SO5]